MNNAASKTATAVLTVPGMGSNHCAGLVSTSLKRLEGVTILSANIGTHRIEVSYDPARTSPDELKKVVERGGYDVTAVDSEGTGAAERTESEDIWLEKVWKTFLLGGIPAAVIMAVMAMHMFMVPVPFYLAIVAVLAFPTVFIAGRETHKSAWKSLTNRTANMDVLISLGSLPPYLLGLIGFFYPMTSFMEMAATIMAFHLLGRYLEARAKGRASSAIRKLLNLGAKTALVVRDGQETEIDVRELVAGDIMIVKPGGKIPTDGEVVDGHSQVDESIATGESVPADKNPGDSVLGATINQSGLLKIKATKIGAETFLAQVIKLVEEAQGAKVPIQEFADRVTGWFVPAVLVISLASLAAWLAFYPQLQPILAWGGAFLPWVNPEITPLMGAILAAIAVLVIACPCALGLATPTALMVGSGMGAERGILFRSGEAIQTMKDIKYIALDKTGTITEGKPSLTDMSGEDALRLAAAVEAGSEHPLAHAIVEGAKAHGLDAPEVKNFQSHTAMGVEGMVDGQRIFAGSPRLMEKMGLTIDEELTSRKTELEAQGKTVMLVANEKGVIGFVAVADTVRKDSAEAIKALKAMGISPVMLTGDNERTARHVAALVGIEEVYANVLPEDKVKAVRDLQEKHGPYVAMVGDGINDAPALKQANVGIAVGAGADIAIEAADMTLVRSSLATVTEAVHLSRATFRKIVQNLFWAWIYNLAAIPVAAAGLLHPMIGVIAMTASSLSVIGNSLLLRRQ